MQNALLVSVVILNWNGGDYVRNCVKSVLETEFPRHLIEIIVVDNGSTDGSSAELIRRLYPQIKLIKNEKNLGFCAGNNIGVKNASGNLIVLLNNDVVVNKRWIKDLMKMAKDPEVGIVGCRLYYPETRIIQSNGFDMKWLGFWEAIGSGEIDNGQFNHVKDVDFVSGAAFAIKSELIDKVGLFDSELYAYCEDLDLCYRARNAGYRVVTSDAIVYHHGSVSFGRFPIKKIYLTNKNTIWFILKNYPLRDMLRYAFEFPIRILKENICRFLMKSTVLQKLDTAKKKVGFSRIGTYVGALKTELISQLLFVVALFSVMIHLSLHRKENSLFACVGPKLERAPND